MEEKSLIRALTSRKFTMRLIEVNVAFVVNLKGNLIVHYRQF